MALRAPKRTIDVEHTLRTVPSQDCASPTDAHVVENTNPVEAEWLIPPAKNVYDYAKYRSNRGREGILAEPLNGTKADIKFVKTGMSSAPPPCFLTAPLPLKNILKKDNFLQHFYLSVKWKAKAPYFLSEPSDGVNQEPKLRAIPKSREDSSEAEQLFSKLTINQNESVTTKAVATDELKNLLGKLLVGLESSNKKQVQAMLSLKEKLEALPPSLIVQVHPQNEPIKQIQGNIPKSEPRINPPPIKKKKFIQILLKELNKAMKKMSIAGLFLGILILGLLFFFIGFLASYSSLKGQQKECPPPPTPPVFSDTIMEVKGAPSGPSKDVKEDKTGTSAPDKGAKKEKKEEKYDLTKMAKEAIGNEAQKLLPTSGVLGTIASAVVGPSAEGKSIGQRASNAAERIALNRLTRGGAASHLSMNSLSAGIRPFAQQAQQQLHHPDHPVLSQKAAALRGPFAPKRYGTTPPVAPKENRHLEQGYGRGSLQDAYRQRYGSSEGIRPHVPKPVFAPPMAGAASPHGHNAGAAMPPVLMPMTQHPYPQNSYPQGGYPQGGYGEVYREQQPPIDHQQHGVQPYYMAPVPMQQMPAQNYPPQGIQGGYGTQGGYPQYPQYDPGYAPEYGAAYAPGYPPVYAPGNPSSSPTGEQPRRLIGMG